MLRATRIPVLLTVLMTALALGLTACSGGDDPTDESTFVVPEGKASNPEKSCQAIVGSGALDDIQKVWDQYKGNNQPFTAKDEEELRTALDALAKAGDNAAPDIREDVVTLVADVSSQIDSRAGLPGTGQVAKPADIQRQIDALCR
jgi:hypothetical protein